MNPLDRLSPAELLSGESGALDSEFQEALAAYPLESIGTEYPHYQGAVDSPDGAIKPKERHPVFYGCFDWHSAVHSHWCLIRQLRLFEDHPCRAEITEAIDGRFTPEQLRAEVSYFEENPTFERPYGWAWLLRLAAELSLWDADRATRWRKHLRPLESKIVDLVEEEFLTQRRPFRVGTHDNSAFALAAVWDYATITGNTSLRTTTRETALDFFADDEDYPVAYEPLGWDFLSPGLTEADLMRRLLDDDAFAEWIGTFLPDLCHPAGGAVVDPVEVESDPTDGVALHLVGLNLSKAWSLAGLVESLPDSADDELVSASAKRHAEVGLSRAFTDDYAGSHWLSSFVCYLLTRNEGGIAPN